jgi:hypothetical protein
MTRLFPRQMGGHGRAEKAQEASVMEFPLPDKLRRTRVSGEVRTQRRRWR